jgi:phosphomannomutase
MCLAAAIHKNKSISELFNELPTRFSQAGLLNNFPQEDSNKIIAKLAKDDNASRALIKKCFTSQDGFGEIETINSLDGIRISFKNGDLAHIRPSGNAPQLRIYAVADSQARANTIVEIGLKKDGVLKSLQKLV